MWLPKQIKIGAYTHQVLYPFQFAAGVDLCGQILGTNGEIRLSEQQDGVPYPPEYVWQTFFHEVCHRVGRLVGSKELAEGEEINDRVAHLVLQILMDNGWLMPELPGPEPSAVTPTPACKRGRPARK